MGCTQIPEVERHDPLELSSMPSTIMCFITGATAQVDRFAAMADV